MIRIPWCSIPPQQHYDTIGRLKQDMHRYLHARSSEFETGPFAPPTDKFEIIQASGNSYILLPTASDYAFLFRGQNAFYKDCAPTLYRRRKTPGEIFEQRLKCAEFQLMAEELPAVQYFRQQKFSIDYLGLAQHYGLQTDILDLTVDPDIALFFAMCDYDPRNDRYTAKSQEREYIGYLYAINVFSYTDYSPKKLENLFTSKLKAIGLQPFDRPGNQKAFSLHLDEGEKLKANLYSFNYTKQDSEEYCRKYAYLWRSDMLSERTKSIRDTKIYSHQALSLATKKWGDGKSRNYWERQMRNQQCSFTAPHKCHWKFTSDEIQKAVSEWQNHGLGQIRRLLTRRRLITGNRQTGCNTTSSLYHTLVLKNLQGGFPAPGGYDSGIVKLLSEKDKMQGWETDTAFEHSVPEADGKIHRYNQILDWSPTRRLPGDRLRTFQMRPD